MKESMETRIKDLKLGMTVGKIISIGWFHQYELSWIFKNTLTVATATSTEN